MCPPKVDRIEILENLFLSSRDRDFQLLISPVSLFGDGMMGGTLIVL